MIIERLLPLISFEIREYMYIMIFNDKYKKGEIISEQKNHRIISGRHYDAEPCCL